MKTKFGTDLTKGSVFKKLIIFVIPIMLSGLLQQLYNAADTVVVGKFAQDGETALAAVGSTSALTNLILNLFIGLSVGANVICARLYGAKNNDGLFRAVHTSLLLGLVSGIGLAVFGFIFAKPLLLLTGTPKDVLGPASLYMKVYFLGAPASLVYNFGAGILRASGDTRRPLYILAVSGIVNVLLNLLCVIVFGLGVLGVALGTIASQLLSAIVVIVILIRTREEVRFVPKKMRFYRSELLNVIKIGIPSGISGVMFSISNVIIQSTVNTYEKTAIAGNTAAWSIEIFAFLVLSSFEQGIVSFAGQNMGAKQYKRVEKGLFAAVSLGMLCTMALEAAMLIFGDTLLGFYTNEQAVVEMGLIRLSVMATFYFMYVPNQVCAGCLRGMGYSTAPALINGIFICGLRIVWIFFVYPHAPSLKMLYYSYPISWTLSSVAQVSTYFIIRRKAFGFSSEKTDRL